MSTPQISIDFLWTLSFCFVLLAVAYLIFVFYFRNSQSSNEKQIMEKRKVFSPMICEFLFYNKDGKRKEKVTHIELKIQIRALIKNKMDREVLRAVLLDLRKDVSGKTAEDLMQIYEALDLHKDAYKKLHSWHWVAVSQGITELTHMEVQDSYGLILPFINDKRSTIRKQAEIAIVSLKEEGINYFLDHTRFKISEWQQLKLLDVVRNKTDYQPPAFSLWLTSKNNHVVLFALRLMKYYNQNKAEASLIQLLRHKNHQIKKEAIVCITHFNIVTSLPMLKTIFWTCTPEVQMYILDAISKLGNNKEVLFLKTVIAKEVTFTVKSKAITALNTIQPEQVLPTQDILPKTDFAGSQTITNTSNPEKLETEQNTKVDTANAAKPTTQDILPTLNEEDLVLTPLEISFLPIIIDKETSTPKKAKHLYKKTNTDASNEDLLHFLPIVTDIDVHSDNEDLAAHLTLIYKDLSSLHLSSYNTTADNNEQKTKEISVTYEQVSPAGITPTSITAEEKRVIAQCDVYYEHVQAHRLGALKDHQKQIPTTQNTTTMNLEVKNISPVELETEKSQTQINNITVSYEFVNPKEENIGDFETNIDWSTAFEPKRTTPKAIPTVSKTTTPEKKQQKAAYPTGMPKAHFYGENILHTMVLLEDIAELGDPREIPFLNTLLTQESNGMVKAKILSLIDTFSSKRTVKDYFKIPTSASKKSVFRNLFSNSDIGLQLLLLAEIAEVGDEKELALLDNLTTSPDLQIQEAAKHAIAQIITKIEAKTKLKKNQAPATPVKSKSLPIDKAAQHITKEKHTDNTYGNTLFDHLCAMSTTLYSNN